MEQAYCVKCRAKRGMTNPKVVTKSGRRFMFGNCEKCGTKMSRIMGKK
jgi:hypothetical protein